MLRDSNPNPSPNPKRTTLEYSPVRAWQCGPYLRRVTVLVWVLVPVGVMVMVAVMVMIVVMLMLISICYGMQLL